MPDPEPDLNPLCDADPLARALAKLRPAPAAVDPVRVAFLAGQASVATKARFWRRAALAQGVVLLVVGGLAVAQFVLLSSWLSELKRLEGMTPPPAQPAVRPVGPERAPEPRAAPEPYPEPVELTAAPTPANTDELGEYLRVRREVLAAGLGLLPESTARPLPPVSPTELEKSLQLPPGVLAYPFAAPPRPKAPPEPDPDSPE